MKKSIITAISAALILNLYLSGCGDKDNNSTSAHRFITVKDGKFYKGDSIYTFVGANFWYGAILGSTGQGGNRERLGKELDLMQANGIDNIRVLVGGDGTETVPTHIRPVLQTAPRVYNDTILEGLDYLMAELEKRDMHAVLYLTNAWEWSGGYGTYLEWAGLGTTPDLNADGWEAYRSRVAQFVTNDSAKAMADRHVDYIVNRTNRYTGKPYSESPALMTWEVANEPRAFAGDSVTKAAYYDWVTRTARRIKAIDKNHLVSTGSEGYMGTEMDLELWKRLHESEDIDYAIIHLWPYNWSWLNQQDPASVVDSVDVALAKTVDYIKVHAEATEKPLVLEEFGYPRDSMMFSPGSPTTGRDAFYKGVFDLISGSGMIQGCNIWGWGGYAQPKHEKWEPWDDYTCDPSQEPQGLNSVFASDTTTLAIIKGNK
ncbi:MAG: cellulase family glycosylhydrolase [Muribaculaceae bacterium]|nr:cellulase family glycosylhydrolase [Muribaculaceae bacterium]